MRTASLAELPNLSSRLCRYRSCGGKTTNCDCKKVQPFCTGRRSSRRKSHPDANSCRGSLFGERESIMAGRSKSVALSQSFNQELFNETAECDWLSESRRRLSVGSRSGGNGVMDRELVQQWQVADIQPARSRAGAFSSFSSRSSLQFRAGPAATTTETTIV